MRGGLFHFTIMILLPYLSRCCEVLVICHTPTIFQNEWFCTRISNFFQSPIFSIARPPAPMNHVKYLRAGPSKMPLGCWYNCGTNRFERADFYQAKMNKPTMLINKSSIYRMVLCGESDFCWIFENKSSDRILNICTEG